jgi:glc operon protein GlcG
MLANKPYLTQANVQAILDAADAHAAQNNWAVTIAVCDDGGHMLGMIRRDGCAPVSAYIAQEKARTAAMGKRESRVYEEIINNGPHLLFVRSPHSRDARGWRQYRCKWIYHRRSRRFRREVFRRCQHC